MLKQNFPPGPDSPRVEQTFRLYSKPYSFLKECEKKYGDCFALDLQGSGKHVFFSRPQTIQQIFSGSPEIYHAGRGQDVLKPFLGEFSLITLDEGMHKRHRKIINPAFQPQSLKGFASIMETIVDKLISKWKPGQTFYLEATMLDIAFDVILGAIFGIDAARWIQPIKKALAECMDEFGANPLPFVASENSDKVVSNKISDARGKFRKKLQKNLSKVDTLIYAEIKRRRSTADKIGVDALSLLLKTTEDGSVLSEQEIRDELMTLIIAGHETTGSTLAWAFYWLLSYPEILEKCLKELESMDVGLNASPSDLPYLDAVLKETMRICPVLPWVSRELQSETEIQGWTLPIGTHVTACMYLTHHREELYPESETFHPDRFFKRQFSAFEYYPFGGGARRCIGMYFAQTEMKLILSKALKSFSFAMEKGIIVRPVSRSVTVAPSSGLRIEILKKRVKSNSELMQ